MIRLRKRKRKLCQKIGQIDRKRKVLQNIADNSIITFQNS